MEGIKCRGWSRHECRLAMAAQSPPSQVGILFFAQRNRKTRHEGAGFPEDFSSPRGLLATKPYADTARSEKPRGDEKDPESIF
jgi:hypothetical protein